MKKRNTEYPLPSEETVQLYQTLFTDSQRSRTPDEMIERQHHGWMLPYLFAIDLSTTRRWDYFIRKSVHLSPKIPVLHWSNRPKGVDHINRCLSGFHDCLEDFVDWLRYALGHPRLKGHVTSITSKRNASYWYQKFDLYQILSDPGDSFATVLAERNRGRGSGFFPTPMSVCQMMAEIAKPDGSTNDPCMGTGSLLLASSNHATEIYGQELSPFICNVAWINLFLFAPWAHISCGDSLRDPNQDYQLVSQHLVDRLHQEISSKK